MRAPADDATPQPERPAGLPSRAPLLRALAVVPPLLLAWLVWRFGVDVPFLDEWSLAYDIERFLDGAWTSSEVLRAHNGHRIAIPRLVLVPLATATGWNVRVELALNIAVGVAIFALVACATRDLARTVSPTGRAAFVLLASLLVFSLAQFENWLWGIQLQALLGVAFSLAGLAWLRHDAIGVTELGVALLMGVGAALCQATGLVYGFAAAIPLALPRARGSGLPLAARTLPWLAIVLAATVAYLQARPGDAMLPLDRSFLADPLGTGRFVASFLGAGLAAFTGAAWPPRDDGTAWLVGTAGLVAAGALARPHLRRSAPSAPWFRFLAGGAAFSLGSALAVAVSRGATDPSVAFASRYGALSMPLWLFVGALAVERAWPARKTTRRGVAASRIGVLLLLVLASASSLGALGAYAKRAAELGPARRALVAGAPEHLLALLHPELHQVRDGRRALERRGLSVFRDGGAGATGAAPGAPASSAAPAAPAAPERLAAFAQRLAFSAPPPTRLPAGLSTALAVTAENASGVPWPSLGGDAEATGRVDLRFRFHDPASGALIVEGVAAELPHDVAPGGRVALVACVRPPPAPGRYRLALSLVQQHLASFDDAGSPGLALDVEVAPGSWRASAQHALAHLLVLLGAPGC